MSRGSAKASKETCDSFVASYIYIACQGREAAHFAVLHFTYFEMPKEVATVTAVAETATVTAVAKTADVTAVAQDDGAIW